MSNATAPAAQIPSDPTMANIPGIWNVTGPMLLGHLVNYLLLGILMIQLYVYTLSFSRDLIGIKILVWVVFIMDIIQTCFTTHYSWYALAAGWGNPLVLRFYPVSLVSVPPLSGLIALAVQLFFAWRIWILAEGRKLMWPVLFLIVGTGVGSCSAAIYAGVVSGRSLDAIAGMAALDPIVTGWFSSGLACDFMITATLVLQLWARKGQGLSHVDNILHRAIRLAIETGAVTTIVVGTDLAFFTHPKVTQWYYMLGMFIGKLYSNSLLASLNSRSEYFKKPSARGASAVQVFQSIDVTRGTDSTVHNTAHEFSNLSAKKNDVESQQKQYWAK